MTYDEEKKRLGREPVWIVELHLDYCSLIYGAAPCTAAIGTTGADKCYNTNKTCQDKTNYTKTTKVYRFSNVILPPSGDLEFQTINCVDNVDFLPSKIEPGKGIGKRSVVTVSLNDFTHSDLTVDKYVSGRAYDSATTGTYFTKLMSRNPYYQGRKIIIKTGYIQGGVAPDAANFESREYLIERIEGPDKAGKIRVTGKDPLRALDEKRSVAPRASTGKLLLALNNSDGVFSLTPAGVGDLEYAASGHIVIEEEVMSFTRVADVLTVSRAQKNTLAVEHDIDTNVQQCLSYNNIFITDVLYDLLVNYGNIDPAYIDTVAWDAEASVWLTEYDLTTVVTKPIGVGKLIEELSQQCQLFIWWDERTQEIKLKAVRPWAFDTVLELSDRYNILADSQSVKDRPDDRVTQVHVYYGQKNPTEDLEKPWNFKRLNVTTDADAESEDQYGDARIKQIYSRWIIESQLSQAVKLSTRMTERYRQVPRSITLRVDAKDSDAWTGDVIKVTMRTLTDYSGAPLPTYLQIIEAKEVTLGSVYEYTLEDTQFNGRYGFWAPTGIPDYGSATDDQRSRYGFWANSSGLMSDGSPGYKYA